MAAPMDSPVTTQSAASAEAGAALARVATSRNTARPTDHRDHGGPLRSQ